MFGCDFSFDSQQNESGERIGNYRFIFNNYSVNYDKSVLVLIKYSMMKLEKNQVLRNDRRN